MRELDALEEAQIELAHDVLASPEAGHLTGHDDLDHEIATSWRRWHEPSAAATRFAGVPPTVEIALDQTLPVMLSGEPDEYARVPTVLRAFIRYAPAEREVSPTLTLETLEVVDRFEGAFLDKRDSPEVVAARAELAAAFEEIAARSERSWVEQRLLDELGSPEAISSLDTQPLPDETLELTTVPEASTSGYVAWPAWLTMSPSASLTSRSVRRAGGCSAWWPRMTPAIFRRRGSGRRGSGGRPSSGGLVARVARAGTGRNGAPQTGIRRALAARMARASRAADGRADRQQPGDAGGVARDADLGCAVVARGL